MAEANGLYTGTVGESIVFSSAGSSDGDGTIVSYLWEFGDGGSDVSQNRARGQDPVYELEDVPRFHVPEYPLGTMISLLSMMAAWGMMSKRVPKL